MAIDKRTRCAAMLVVGLIWWSACPAWAATPAADAARPSVVVSPNTRAFDQGFEAEQATAMSRALHHGASRLLASQTTQVELVDNSDLATLAAQVDEAELHLKYADLAARSGLQAYKALQTSSAVDNLEIAREEFRYLYLDLLEPRRVAEVALYLALSYLEEGRQTLALAREFQEMMLLDPARQVREGLYPDDVVEAYRSSREFLIRELREEGPDRARARRLVELARSDWAAFVYSFARAEGGHQVTLWMFSREDDRFLKPESIWVPDPTPDRLAEASSRLISRFLPCCLQVPEPPDQVQAASGQSPLSLQVEFAYATFLRFPSPVHPASEGFPPARRSLFGNAGLGLQATYRFTQEFGLTSGVQALNSIRDYNGRLREDFSTVRAFGGADFGTTLGTLNVGASFSLEATRLGDFTAWEDPSCVVRNDCGPDSYSVIDDLDFLLGINLRPRLIWRFFRTYHAVGSVDVSYYFVPLSGRALNFPITGQLGILYRF